MFYLQENLLPTKKILDFFCTRHTSSRAEAADAKIITWDRATKETSNSIILPHPTGHKIGGVKVEGKTVYGIHEIELHGSYSRSGEDTLIAPLCFYRVEVKDGEGIASIELNGKTHPLILRLDDDTILYTFNPGETIDDILGYRYIQEKSSGGLLDCVNRIGSAVAVWLPVKVRNYMIGAYLQLAKRMASDTGYPSWPADNSVDILRKVFLKTLAEVSKNNTVDYLPFWPENKRWCFCSTHDVDTAGGFQNIDFVRKVEKQHPIPSTWYVTHEINPDISFLKRLEAAGCEVGSHGWVHDDKWRLLSDSELEERLMKGADQFKGLEVSGFRAPYNGYFPENFRTLKKYFSYDTSAQETRIYASVRSHRLGCCTQFPFEVDGVIELPSTVPADYLLINTLKKSPEDVYSIWEKKTAQIKEAGGMALLQTHPEEFNIGNDRYIKPYEDLIAKVSAMEDCWITTAREIAGWWKERNSLDPPGYKKSIEYRGGRFSQLNPQPQ